MKKSILSIIALLLTATFSFAQAQNNKKTPESTEVWDPAVRIIQAGDQPGAAPSDAIILFDGKNLDQWVAVNGGGPSKWTVKDNAVTVSPRSGDMKTKLEFGDFQLHVEWRTPAEVDPKVTGQGRGNSGIFLQERYEVQVLDNYENVTYSNGQAGSIYKQSMPLVNACKKPGEWQTYDIIFTAPRFNKEGRVLLPAYVTVIHNGVVVQNHTTLWGPTEYIGLPVNKPYEKGPIRLQDHGNTTSFRNIWIREL
ncbi:MAG: DUF1080 domain-containing protein [Cyclobacteriaceae bacterium]|nr:DUF1080 domain-containing protein [Cyclobacteriaceae bacterium]